MARVLSIVFVALSVLQAAWGSTIHAVDECTSLGIIGGKNATIEEVPSAVSIRIQEANDYSHICGGVIVHEKFILTAAMCLLESNITSLSVRVGSTYLNSGGENAELENVIMHENYNPENITDNIALLKLKKPILFGFLAKAELPEKDSVVAEGTTATFSGWGATNGNATRTEVVHQITIPIKAQKCCKNPDGLDLNDINKICAGAPGYDACQGDGGSPLMQGKVLIGINSYGSGEECGNQPGVYTNIARYVDWINNIITENL